MFNEKKIVSWIKDSGKHQLFWQVIDGKHYITDRRAALRLIGLSPKVEAALIGVFGKHFPGEGETAYIQFNTPGLVETNVSKVVDIDLYETAELTQLLYETTENTLCRFYKLSNKKVGMVSNEYVKLLLDPRSRLVLCGNNLNAPIAIEDDLGQRLLILPFRAMHLDIDVDMMIAHGANA